MSWNFIDLSGKKFGRLVALKLSDKSNRNGTYWDCLCDCGKNTQVKSYNLRSGITKSCGCLSVSMSTERVQTHGLSYSKIHAVWNTMVQRCTNPKVKRYSNYGGRGIKVCDRWMKFELFYEDMGGSYKEGLTLEREKVNGNYEKCNCSWQTMYVQSRNRTDNIFMTYKGKTMIMTDWAKQVGISKNTIWARLKYGWSDSDALTVPIKAYRKKIDKDN